MTRNSILCSILMFIFVTGASANDFVFVQSAKAKIHTRASLSSPVIAQVKRGDKLVVIKKSASWYKTKFKTKQGWISSLLVSKRPPIKKLSVINNKEDESQKKNVRRRASATATAAAARGLKKDTRSRLSRSNKADYKAVEKMEANEPAESEIKKFELDKSKYKGK